MNNTMPGGNPASPTPSAELYGALELAFNHYNNALFDGELGSTIITLSAKGKGTNGYLKLNRFKKRVGSEHADEIALNPANLRDELPVVMAWLVHHMVHLWQAYFGQASRSGYHNQEWAKKMMSLGLRPFSGEADTGKSTGQRVSQTIVQNGLFDSATKALIAARYDLTWQLALEADESDKKEAGKSLGRVPWHCPQCSQRAWAKPSAMLACGRCMVSPRPTRLDVRVQPFEGCHR